MLPVKPNYGDRYENKMCRLCQEEEETQRHILSECRTTKETINHQEYEEYFTQDETEALKVVAGNIGKIMKTLEDKWTSIAPQKWVSNLVNQANAHTHTREIWEPHCTQKYPKEPIWARSYFISITSEKLGTWNRLQSRLQS